MLIVRVTPKLVEGFWKRLARDALGPHCGSVTLTIASEAAPEKADTVTVDPKAIDQIWQDFAPYRTTGR